MEPLKNLLDAKAAERIAVALNRAFPSFSKTEFLRDIKKELEPLELKGRMHLLKSRLEITLPSEPKKSFPILLDAIKQDEEDEEGVSGFLTWPLTEYVAERGLKDFELSMKALHRMTQVFTSEFAIRPFLIHHEPRTLKQLLNWTEDENHHVRRLASEGSRPLLPWGQRLPEFVKNPEKTWPILEALKHDPSKYVQKSVANHINDHSKNHADWVVKRLKPWKKSASNSVEWIIRHGTRTLIKKGHAGVLALHGIETVDFENVRIKILTPKVKVGQALEIELGLTNPLKRELRVIVDCQILFLKANGAHIPKVFKGKTVDLAPNEKRKLNLTLPLRSVTTRRYYSGRHGCALLINGSLQKTQWFELVL